MGAEYTELQPDVYRLLLNQLDGREFAPFSSDELEFYNSWDATEEERRTPLPHSPKGQVWYNSEGNSEMVSKIRGKLEQNGRLLSDLFHKTRFDSRISFGVGLPKRQFGDFINWAWMGMTHHFQQKGKGSPAKGINIFFSVHGGYLSTGISCYHPEPPVLAGISSRVNKNQNLILDELDRLRRLGFATYSWEQSEASHNDYFPEFEIDYRVDEVPLGAHIMKTKLFNLAKIYAAERVLTLGDGILKNVIEDISQVWYLYMLMAGGKVRRYLPLEKLRAKLNE